MKPQTQYLFIFNNAAGFVWTSAANMCDQFCCSETSSSLLPVCSGVLVFSFLTCPAGVTVQFPPISFLFWFSMYFLFQHCFYCCVSVIKTSFLLIRCLLLLAAGSPGRRDTSAGLRPFGAWPVSDITPWLPCGCTDRANIICCHDSCVLPSGVLQSWSQTPQRHERNTRGLKLKKQLNLFNKPVLFKANTVITASIVG